MTDDLAIRQEPVVHPLTGETLDLQTAPDENLARFLADVRDYESRLKEAKAIVSREALRRMDAGASWTLRAGDYTLKGSSPAPSEEWDEIALLSDLHQLVDEGVITEDAAGAAVETVITYKVRKAGINALRKLPGVAQIVDRHSQPVEKTRYVSVGRS